MKHSSALDAWFGVSRYGTLFVLPGGATRAQLFGGQGLFPALEAEAERGLLSVSVDPAYPSQAHPDRVRVFTYFTGSCPHDPALRCARLRRIDLRMTGSGSSRVFSAPDCGGPECEDLIVNTHPGTMHFAGAQLFDPSGNLYLTLGDGGTQSGGCNAQNLGALHGKLLRIDVHTPSETGYQIPPDNPHAEASETCARMLDPFEQTPDLTRVEPCPEIVAAGLRNPFRMSWDPGHGQIWIGDVGSDVFEEVSRFDPAGLPENVTNFGWPRYEGPAFIDRAARQCSTVAQAGMLSKRHSSIATSPTRPPCVPPTSCSPGRPSASSSRCPGPSTRSGGSSSRPPPSSPSREREPICTPTALTVIARARPFPPPSTCAGPPGSKTRVCAISRRAKISATSCCLRREIRRSLLSLRVKAADPPLRMPPLATQIADPVAGRVVDTWISYVTECP